jgi:primary-amine oxidase
MRNPKNDDVNSCHFSFPLDFMVIVDLDTMKVKSVPRIPMGEDGTVTAGEHAMHLQNDPIEPEYIAELQKNPLRTTLKPYQVLQPEGASFRVTGHLIEWEKWRLRVGFNWREG